MEYEVVRYIKNHCPNNQMRDVFFDEAETDNPEAYVRAALKGRAQDVSVEEKAGGGVTVFATSDGIRQEFVFTPI